MTNEEVKPEVEFLEIKIKKKNIITPEKRKQYQDTFKAKHSMAEKRKQYQDTYKAKHPKPVKDTVAKKPYNEKEYKREYMQAHREKYREYYRNYQRRVYADSKKLAELQKFLSTFVMA